MNVLTIFLTLFATCHCDLNISGRARNFSMELFYFTAKETDWHTVIAPLGVWNLLAGISVGATGVSKSQLQHGLFLPKNKDMFLSEYKIFMKNAINPAMPNVLLKNKNYIFTKNTLKINPDYRRNLRYSFDTTVKKLPYEDSQKSANVANYIVRKSHVIKSDVFRPDDFIDAGMILANVILFTGQWQLPFNASQTREEPFYDETGNVIGFVNMMQQRGRFAFANMDNIQASVLELPYGEDERYSFIVLLPYTSTSFLQVFQSMEKVSVKEIIDTLDDVNDTSDLPNIMVKLPRFKISTNVVLNKPLQSMGIINIFDPNSDNFEEISGDFGSFISEIIHKAEIEVTESGTIASASASASSPIAFSTRLGLESFTVNRPYLYFVVEKSTATIIFSGVYSIPPIF